MQLWQQHLMSKQLQERRRLLQLQQLDQEARQLNAHNSQMAPVGKPTVGNQLPETLNAMALNDAYNYMWPNNFIGGVSNTPSNSQMFIAGMNYVQPGCPPGVQNLENGDTILNDESRATRPMGFMPIQTDQSIFGMPVPGTNHADQYSQFLGMHNNCNNMMATAAVTMAEKAPHPSSTFQNEQQSAAQGCLEDSTSATQYVQGRRAFGNSSVQILSNDAASGNFQQTNNLQLHNQFHEFHGRQEQDGLPGNLQEKSATQMGTSVGVASLDPIEEKLLFGTDDANWGASFGGGFLSSMAGDMQGLPLDNDYSGAFPSINSGSWSALMQEAVQSSSSDKGGVQEEWSGLSSQKTEQPIGKPSNTTNVNGKQLAAWDVRNLQNATSLTSRSFPLFNDSTTRSSSISSQGANNKEFLNSQHQTKLIESGCRGEMSSASGIWAGQSTEQCENSSTDIQFKTHNMTDGWIGQQNLPLSGVSIQTAHNLSGWQTSNPMSSKYDNNSNYHDIHGNLWRVAENHVNLNSGSQHANSDMGSPKMQAEDSFAASLGSIENPNMLKLDQNMHQQVLNEQNSVFHRHLTTNTYSNQVESNDENQKQQSRRQQTWESFTSPSAERLVDSFEKESDNGRVLPGKGYVGDAEKELSGSQKYQVQYGQHTVGPKIFQTGISRKIAEPSLPANQQLSLQQLSNSGFDGSNSMEKSFIAQSLFASNICNNHVDPSESITLEAEGLQYRSDIAACPSSSSFDGSTSQYSHNEANLQSSNNMLELLHKVDQPSNGNSGNVSNTYTQVASHVPNNHPHFDPSSNARGFGLRLSPPSQRKPLPNFGPNSKQLFNDIKVGLSGETGYHNQASTDYTSSVQHVPSLDGAFETEKSNKISILSGHQQKKHPESNKYGNSSPATVSDSPLMENQLQEQRQIQQKDIATAKGHLEQKWQEHKHNSSNTSSHESTDQSVKFFFGTPTNVGAIGKNASVNNILHESHDGAVTGQSVQTSLHTLGGRFSTDVASVAENQVTGDSQFPSGGIEHTNPTFAGFSQVTNSGKQLPAVETKLGSQPSISGISQQAGFSRMLHNVWTNISAQRQAGINPLLTPKILQSIINHGRDRSSWSMPKAGSHQVNKEEVAPPVVGTSSNSQNEEDNPLQEKSSNIHTEKVDAAFKSRTATQAEETVLKPSFDEGAGVPISSLVRQHQLDVNKAKRSQAPAIISQVLRSPTNVASSSNDIGVSGHMSKPSDVQPQNYSLLHQIQSMKAVDSDLNTMSGSIARGASFSSDTSQMNFNIHQRFDQVQNSASRFPADVKVREASQVSYPLDAKLLSFASNDSEEKIPSTSAAGQHDLQTQMQPIGASATETMLGGSEHSRISPQMAPSWFDQYGSYQNDRMVTLYAAQSGNTAMHRYLLQKIPARMEGSSSMEQRLNNQVGSNRQRTFATNVTPRQATGSLLHSSSMDHDTIIRSRKRKSLTSDKPWHKIVMECPQRLQDIRSAELDWNLVTNRLMEKVDDEAEATEDDPLFPQSRRRLIMTTQLMHQLFPAVPDELLKGEATSTYESVTFSVTKSALADACSLVSSKKSDLHVPVKNETMTSGELRSSKVQCGTNSNIVEDFIDRSKKLDADLRLDKGSMLDVRLECQDLERFSIVNRLGKFHSRAHADGVEVSATGTVHRTFPQRYITALPVPGNLPDNVPCLSL